MATFKSSNDLSVMRIFKQSEGVHLLFSIVQRKPQSDASFPLTLLNLTIFFLPNMRYYENNY